MHYPVLFPVASIAPSGFKSNIDVVVSWPTNLIPDEITNPLCSRSRILGGGFRLNPAAAIEREVSELCPSRKISNFNPWSREVFPSPWYSSAEPGDCRALQHEQRQMPKADATQKN